MSELIKAADVKQALALLEQGKQVIARVATVGEAKAYADKAAAIRIFAAKQGWSQEQKAVIAEIEIIATARMGELLKENPPKEGRPRKTIDADDSFSLADAGITADQASRARKIASVPPKEREKYISDNKKNGKLSVTGLARVAKEKERESKRAKDREVVAAAPEPHELEGVFGTIVLDPPWDFGDEGDVDQFGRGKPDYATMTIEEIAALPVGDRAAKDSHIYLWITNRSLPKGFGLLDAWGFRYVTCLTWCKPSIGMGNYFRGSTEQILFGVRGSLPLKRKNVGTWFAAPRPQRKHSSKPDEFFDLVESCSHGPYLEMFSRSKREGWTHWGAGE